MTPVGSATPWPGRTFSLSARRTAALIAISGPMPLGSPKVMAMRMVTAGAARLQSRDHDSDAPLQAHVNAPQWRAPRENCLSKRDRHQGVEAAAVGGQDAFGGASRDRVVG